MKIYTVTEYITDGWEENASGTYSSLANAKNAILKRVAEEYSAEEMEQFQFSCGGMTYITVTNDWVEGCTYVIDEIEVDGELC